MTSKCGLFLGNGLPLTLRYQRRPKSRYQQFGSADAYVRMLIERPIIVRSTTRPIFEADAGRAERIARSVSVVGDQDSKRQSYASTASSGTMGSTEGDSRESRLHQSQPDPTIPGMTVAFFSFFFYC
ncbi:hypothetical protein ANCCAN_09628 [Ancylostoma caninum]|uniref:Uncharacterized protein n=1 Tax=Ancylostoma caninum TaxID=29170 RepID=A0A368GIY6_ANCCA|nr:hypothetical protein ANCCAN_09628 [Ancylostoma caninum]